MNRKRIAWITLSSVLVLAFTLATMAFVFPSDTQAQSVIDTSRRQPPGKGEQEPAYLAEALGISVEALQEAIENVKDKALDMLVEAGVITREQAQAMQLLGLHRPPPGILPDGLGP